MGTWSNRLADRGGFCAKKLRCTEHLSGRDELGVPCRQKEYGQIDSRELDLPSKSNELILRDAILLEQPVDDLQVVNPGKVDRRQVPFAEACFACPGQS